MANWLDKFTKVAETVTNAANNAVSSVSKTYKEKGFEGIVEKTGEAMSKAGENIEKATSTATDKTQSYLKSLSANNKEVMNEAETNVGKGTVSGKIASGLAATVNTTKIVADDLVNVSKRVYKNLVEENSATVDNTNSVNRKETHTPTANERFNSIDSIPLETVLNDVLGAQSGLDGMKGKWKEHETGHIYMVLDNSWYAPKGGVGGKNAVSLMAYHLSNLSHADYHDKSMYSQLKEEALNVLESSQSYLSNVKEERKVDIEPVKSTASKKLVVVKDHEKEVTRKGSIKLFKGSEKEVSRKGSIKLFKDSEKEVTRKGSIKNIKINPPVKTSSLKVTKPVEKDATVTPKKIVKKTTIKSPKPLTPAVKTVVKKKIKS